MRAEASTDAKVVSITDIKKKKEDIPKESEPTTEDKDKDSFEDIMKANADKQKKLKEERAKANRSVLRSYRLKT